MHGFEVSAIKHPSHPLPSLHSHSQSSSISISDLPLDLNLSIDSIMPFMGIKGIFFGAMLLIMASKMVGSVVNTVQVAGSDHLPSLSLSSDRWSRVLLAEHGTDHHGQKHHGHPHHSQKHHGHPHHSQKHHGHPHHSQKHHGHPHHSQKHHGHQHSEPHHGHQHSEPHHGHQHSKPHHGHQHHFLNNQRTSQLETCDRSLRVCRAEGSPGPNCCRKRCVDLMSDSLNCGRCGSKCGFGQTCCGGKCLGVMNNNNNCGGCSNKCGNGSYCKLGLCGYA